MIMKVKHITKVTCIKKSNFTNVISEHGKLCQVYIYIHAEKKLELFKEATFLLLKRFAIDSNGVIEVNAQTEVDEIQQFKNNDEKELNYLNYPVVSLNETGNGTSRKLISLQATVTEKSELIR